MDIKLYDEVSFLHKEFMFQIAEIVQRQTTDTLFLCVKLEHKEANEVIWFLNQSH